MSTKNKRNENGTIESVEWSPEMEAEHQEAVEYINEEKPVQTEQEYNYTNGVEPEIAPLTDEEIAKQAAQAAKENEMHLRKLFNRTLIVVSRCPGVQYEIGQYGICEFTVEQVIAVSYRIDFPETDNEIAKRLSKLVKQGLLVKVKRGTYKASHLLTMDTDTLFAELDKRAANRP